MNADDFHGKRVETAIRPREIFGSGLRPGIEVSRRGKEKEKKG